MGNRADSVKGEQMMKPEAQDDASFYGKMVWNQVIAAHFKLGICTFKGNENHWTFWVVVVIQSKCYFEKVLWKKNTLEKSPDGHIQVRWGEIDCLVWQDFSDDQ